MSPIIAKILVVSSSGEKLTLLEVTERKELQSDGKMCVIFGMKRLYSERAGNDPFNEIDRNTFQRVSTSEVYKRLSAQSPW